LVLSFCPQGKESTAESGLSASLASVSLHPFSIGETIKDESPHHTADLKLDIFLEGRSISITTFACDCPYLIFRDLKRGWLILEDTIFIRLCEKMFLCIFVTLRQLSPAGGLHRCGL